MLPRWRMTRIVLRTRVVVEAEAGTFARHGIAPRRRSPVAITVPPAHMFAVGAVNRQQRGSPSASTTKMLPGDMRF